MKFSKMLWKMSRARAAVAALVLVTFIKPASAEWKDLSSTLPGTTSGAKIAVVAGLAGAGVVALLIYRHVHHPARLPVEITPTRMEFGAGREQSLTIRATEEGVNFSEMTVKGAGYSIRGGQPALPMLLKVDQPFELKVKQGNAGKGEIDLTFIDQTGKAHSKAVALLTNK